MGWLLEKSSSENFLTKIKILLLFKKININKIKKILIQIFKKT